MKKVVIYARVSTNVQDYERQVNELKALAVRNEWVVEATFCEKISGAKKIVEREQLSKLIACVRAHKIDKVLIYECSRLSRRIVDFLQIVEQLNDLKVSLYIHQNGMETLQADGTVNPIAQLVLGVMAQFSSMERSLIRSRMESGYKSYRASGGKVGRKEGYRKSKGDMREQYAEEMRLLRKGISLRNIAKITGTSVNTIRKCQAFL